MRVGASILFNQETCWQSYSWSLFRPLGGLQGVIDALDEYECDEISIVRPIRAHDSRAQLEADINMLKNTTSLTPLSFGGGIRTIEQVAMLKGSPIERLVFSSAFFEQDFQLLEYVRTNFGRQSIQCLLPCLLKDEKLWLYKSSSAQLIPFESIDLSLVMQYANDFIIHDIVNEGDDDSFNRKLLHHLPFGAQRTVISGGIGQNTIAWASKQLIAACLLDNRTLHQEFSISGYKCAANL
jgi:phosphoribosylformimino-5-aminoimidazole carboxamide ribonucleotide (ProFAR) isomerase